MPTFYPNQAAADYLAALNALANNGSMATTDTPQTFTALKTFSAGLTVSSGTLAAVAGTFSTTLGVTGALTASTHISSGAANNYGLIGISGSSAGTAVRAYWYDAAGAANSKLFFIENAGGTLYFSRIDDDNFSNAAYRMSISNAGAVTIPSLAGTGTRAVVASSTGVLSAP